MPVVGDLKLLPLLHPQDAYQVLRRVASEFRLVAPYFRNIE